MSRSSSPQVRGMESWLTDVKRVRIPRPKFGSRCPAEPPKDYCEEDKTKRGPLDLAALGKATEDLRRAIQDKL
ncbi:uncharacterized protein LOC117646947 [Thrips palmi]|uniref:Uncharacterized protein LOC117646947 n=1 Tax=Thrips palmi TaxID=161013 RepID=A0A6P8ZAM8_THRPL|nr:uncharacterized protein LOC117646947 [Thrips palmi]